MTPSFQARPPAIAPALPPIPKEWLRLQEMAQLTIEEKGAYVRLLVFCRKHGSIPADAELCQRIVGNGASVDLVKVVQGMFQPSPSNPLVLVHARLGAGWASRAEARHRSWERRRERAEAQQQAQRVACILDGDPVPPAIRRFELELQPEVQSFDEFWKAFPRKDRKARALSEWLSLVLKHRRGGWLQVRELILADVARRNLSYDWKNDSGHFFPCAVTYLADRMWEEKWNPAAPVVSQPGCPLSNPAAERHCV